MKISTISDPAAGERLIGLSPEMAPAVRAGWQRRLNFYTGRALSDAALITEQDHRAGHLTTRGQLVTAGVVSGLDVGLEELDRPGTGEEPIFIRVSAGFGVSAAGEDVILPVEMRVSFRELPVAAPAAALAGEPTQPGSGAPQARRIARRRLQALLDDEIALPPAGILLLQPIVIETQADQDPNDPCLYDPAEDAFDNLQKIDGCRLVLYAWPVDVIPLPPRTSYWRNHLAHLLLSFEAALPPGEPPPWAAFGLPIALLGFDPAFQPRFADSYAVRRLGGRSRLRTPLLAGTGTPFVWQARIEQLAEQTNELIAAGARIDDLTEHLRFLPPAGLLPREAVAPRAGINRFFPDWYVVEALPVPEEQLDLVLRESARLEPFDRFRPDRVRVLVPVPQPLYDPHLLEIMAVDPEFQETIDAFVTRRSKWLRRRQDVRDNAAHLVEAVSGEQPEFPTPDPDALADEFDDDGNLIVADDPLDPDDPQLADPELLYGIEVDDDGEVTIPVIESLRDFLRQNTPLRGERAIFIDRPAEAITIPESLSAKARYIDLGDQLNAKITFTGRMTDTERSTLLTTLQPAAGANGTRAEIDRKVTTLFNRAQEDQIEKLDELGLKGFIDYLEDLIRRADDKIDLGFALARTDIYRVRQLMLGTAEASKLATSPALAAIAQGETATASRKDVSEFVEKFRLTPGDDGQEPGTLAPGDLPTGGGSGGARLARSDSGFELAGGEHFLAGPQATAGGFESFIDITGGTRATGAIIETQTFSPSSRLAVESLTLSSGQLFTRPDIKTTADIGDVIGQSAIVGKATELRNVTVAERLKSPPAQESKDNSVATMYDTVKGLSDVGIHLDDLDVAGTLTFAGDGNGGQVGQRRLFSMVDLSVNNFNRLLNEPDRNNDEGQLFANTVDVIDRTVNVLRRVEGRIRAYRQALARCRETLLALQKHLREANSRLQVIGTEIAEARHDVAIARALLAEETVRVEGINEQRDEIVVNHVAYLAYQRPRLSSLIITAEAARLPRRALLPAVTESPLPACFRVPASVPGDLQQMVDLWREVPVSWLTYVRPKFQRLDKLDLLQTTVLTAKARVAQPQKLRLPATTQPQSSGLGGSITRLLQTQRQTVTLQRQALTVFNPAELTRQSWQQSIVQAERLVSIADILEAPHGRSELDSELTRELEKIAQVAGCLYAMFGDVVPSIRLDWAERLSQFDEAVNLRTLAALPRWGEIDYLDRREMQALVDWLYGRIDPRKPEATAMMHDLVRICILLASHAPVSQILAGQIDEPVVIKPGGSIKIAIDPKKVRVGMNVLLFDRQEVIGQAVVANLQTGKVAATIMETSRPGVQLAAGAQVQIGEMAALSRNARTQGFWLK